MKQHSTFLKRVNVWKSFSRSFMLLGTLLLTTFTLFSQTMTVSSTPPLNGGNSSNGVTFTVAANNSINITDFGLATASATSGTYQLWYSTTSLTGAPTITTAGGWSQLATGSITGAGVGSVVPLNSNINISMNSGQTYRFYILFSGNVSYSNGTATANTYSDANVTLAVGGNVGYGGNIPNPTFNPRMFNGSVMYELSTPCSNPVTGGSAIASVSSACPSAPVQLSLSGASGGIGMSFQWQELISGVWTDISGATGGSYSTVVTTPTYYRCEIACSGGTAAFSDSVFVDVEPFFNCYCSAGATATTYGYIEEFEFADIQYTSPTGCGQAYTNNTSVVGTAFFGNTYNLEAYVNNCTGSTTYNTGFKVWIDYNQNGSFADPGEEVISQNLTYYQVHGGPITIPSTALTGVTGMRVMVVESGSLAAMNPCYSFTWGEVEDYAINIQAPPMNDAGVSEIVTPMLPYCGGDSVVRVKLMNYGTDTLFNATLNLVINNGTPITSTWTGVIPPFTIDTNIVVAGTNPAGSFTQGDDIIVYTTLPNGVSDSLSINDSVTLLGLTSGLAGVYNIPGDFSTISGAVDTLNMFGTCDTVWFEIANGTYNEPIVITEFPRFSAGSPVIFMSASSDSADVIWDNTTSASTIELNGADYIWFEDLTIKNSTTSGNVININSSADYNKVERSHLVGVSINSTLNTNATIYNQSGIDSYNSYFNNHIENGSFGIYSYGSSTTVLEPGTVIEGNTIENFYYMGCYNYYQDDMIFNHNSLTSNSIYTSMYGIYCYYTNGDFEMIGNHVYPTDGTDGFYMGCYISQGIGNDPFDRGTIANNIFIGGRAGETGTVYGMYTANASAKNFYHNTFLVLDGGASARALYASGNNAAEYMNNIFAVLPIDSNSSYGTGNAAYYTGGITFGLDHNNYYSGGTSPIYFNAAYNSLQSFQDATSNDLNSFDVNPNFTDTINAILCNDTLDAAAMVVGITTDFNGNMRNPSTPDIGAIEFQGVGTLTLGPDTTICNNETNLMVGAGGTVIWQDATSAILSNGNSIVVNASTAFPVSVSYTNSCGTASADVSLTFVPNVNLDATLHLCAGASETLSPDGNGSPSATYAWFPNGEATAQLEVDAPGVYSITKSEDGCVSQANVLVTQSEEITLVDAEACQTNLPYSVNATIANATSYNWSGGSSTSTAQNDFTTSGDYSITATDSFGCTTIDTFSFEVIDVPVAVISNDSHASNLFFLSSLASQNAGANATYFWTFGDGSTSTDPNPSHLFPWNGAAQTFTVTLTITNECGTSTTVTTEITSDPLGVSGIENASALLVYPNPTNGSVTISGDFSSNNINLQVIDLSGRVVKSISNALLANNQFELDLQDLAKGSYQIKIVNGADVQVAKVILN